MRRYRSLVYLSPDWKYSVFEAIHNEIFASSTSNVLFDINPTPLYEQNFQTNLVEIECDGYFMGQIDFYTTKNIPSGITSNPYVDVSLGNDNTVKAYYKENDVLGKDGCSHNLYNIYIVGDGIIVFPEDSSELFAYLVFAKEINFNNSIDTSNVTSMSEMFTSCTNLEELDLSSFDTSNVTNMSHMFCNTNYESLGIDESKFSAGLMCLN